MTAAGGNVLRVSVKTAGSAQSRTPTYSRTAGHRLLPHRTKAEIRACLDERGLATVIRKVVVVVTCIGFAVTRVANTWATVMADSEHPAFVRHPNGTSTPLLWPSDLRINHLRPVDLINAAYIAVLGVGYNPTGSGLRPRDAGPTGSKDDRWHAWRYLCAAMQHVMDDITGAEMPGLISSIRRQMNTRVAGNVRDVAQMIWYRSYAASMAVDLENHLAAATIREQNRFARSWMVHVADSLSPETKRGIAAAASPGSSFTDAQAARVAMHVIMSPCERIKDILQRGVEPSEHDDWWVTKASPMAVGAGDEATPFATVDLKVHCASAITEVQQQLARTVVALPMEEKWTWATVRPHAIAWLTEHLSTHINGLLSKARIGDVTASEFIGALMTERNQRQLHRAFNKGADWTDELFSEPCTVEVKFLRQKGKTRSAVKVPLAGGLAALGPAFVEQLRRALAGHGAFGAASPPRGTGVRKAVAARALHFLTYARQLRTHCLDLRDQVLEARSPTAAAATPAHAVSHPNVDSDEDEDEDDDDDAFVHDMTAAAARERRGVRWRRGLAKGFSVLPVAKAAPHFIAIDVDVAHALVAVAARRGEQRMWFECLKAAHGCSNCENDDAFIKALTLADLFDCLPHRRGARAVGDGEVAPVAARRPGTGLVVVSSASALTPAQPNASRFGRRARCQCRWYRQRWGRGAQGCSRGEGGEGRARGRRS